VRPSVKARLGSWQEAQLTVPSAERRVSKKSIRPSSTFAAVIGLSEGMKYDQRSSEIPRGICTWKPEVFSVGPSARTSAGTATAAIRITKSFIAGIRFMIRIQGTHKPAKRIGK